MDGQGTIRLPGLRAPAEKKNKVEDKKATTSKSVKSEKPAKSSSDSRPAKSSTDTRFEELDQKWSDQFNRLEAFLMARTLDRPQEPTFSTVKVAPTHTLPANVVRTEPFIKPTDQPSQHTDRPTSSDLTGTDPPATRQQFTSKSHSD